MAKANQGISTMVQEEKNISSTPKETGGQRKCQACDMIFPDVDRYADHLESKEHIKGVMKKKYGEKYLEAKANLLSGKVEKEDYKDSESSEDSDDGKVYTCKICEKICTGPLSYRLHLSGKKHQKNVKKGKALKQMQNDKILPENDDSIEDNPLMNAIFTRNEFSTSEILCKICNKKCSGPEAFKQHNKSEAHRKKIAMQNMMKNMENLNKEGEKPESDDETPSIFAQCDICCKEFSGPLPYQQHMQSPSHLKQAQNDKKMSKFKNLYISSEDTDKIQCKECSKYFSGPKPFQDHLKSSLHQKLKKKMDLLKMLQDKHPEMDMMPNTMDMDSEETIITCTVCHAVFSGPESARDHFQSQRHEKVMKEKTRLEQLKLLKDDKKSNTKMKSNLAGKNLLKKNDEEDNDSDGSFDIIG